MASEQHADPPGQIVVCITAEAVSAVAPAGSAVDDRGDELQEVLGDTARLQPLFDESQARLRQYADDARGRHGPGIPDLSRFYRVELDDEATRRSPEALVERLQASNLVKAAYFKHRHELAERTRPRTAPDAEPALRTPDFTELQGYLGPAPAGIDARFAWSGPGGTGEGVQIIDIENAWRFSHEDLLKNQGGVLNTAPDDRAARNHGTAVAGILGGDANAYGITGICPGARVSGISVDGEPGDSAGAIRRAADRLRPGDIVLIEDHSFGPVTLEQSRSARSSKQTVGFVPIDIWPDDFAAVKYATDRGIIVVAAAGNGDRNLDEVDELLRGGGGGEPWANPFDREEADSGAIFVGAGAAPGGEHPDRSRLRFSNWGSCLDAQGWGERVVTTGGVGDAEGDLQGGPYEDRWYTKSFSGTSSAAPMVAGALACVQGVLRAEGLPPLTPRQARALLRVTGSPQAAAASGPLKRIGQRPNLRELIPRALMFVGGADFVGGAEPEPYGGGMNVSIVFDDCGGGGGQGWGGSPWGGPHWRGPHWRGPHWRGPHWRGPSWDEPDALGPRDDADPFGAGAASSPMADGGRREIRLPGFSD